MEYTEKTIEERGLKNTKFLATFFGRTERHIQQLATDKVIKSIRIKGVNYYELIPTIQSYIRYLQEIVDRRKKTNEEQESEKLEADIRYKKAKADRAELDLKIFKAELLVSEDVRAYSEDLAATTKSLLTALPGRLAMDVSDGGRAAGRAFAGVLPVSAYRLVLSGLRRDQSRTSASGRSSPAVIHLPPCSALSGLCGWLVHDIPDR